MLPMRAMFFQQLGLHFSGLSLPTGSVASLTPFLSAGTHIRDVPAFPYSLLWGEPPLLSVASLTRQDGVDFLRQVAQIGIVTATISYALGSGYQA